MDATYRIQFEPSLNQILNYVFILTAKYGQNPAKSGLSQLFVANRPFGQFSQPKRDQSPTGRENQYKMYPFVTFLIKWPIGRKSCVNYYGQIRTLPFSSITAKSGLLMCHFSWPNQDFIHSF